MKHINTDEIDKTYKANETGETGETGEIIAALYNITKI